MQSHPLVYLDHAATTPMRPEAIEAMLPFLAERYANPSGSHRFARGARQALDEAREVVAVAIGCRPGEIVFTSGGTESDNSAIRGVLARRPGHAVCPATEHHAVLEPVERAHGRVVATDCRGTVELDALSVACDGAAVVSVMAVNNEVGTITDLAKVAEVVRGRAPGAVLHTDAVQAASWLDLRSIWPHVDLLSLSAHKFGGPKGVGVFVVRDGITFEPLLVGGGQERERRSGTQNVAGIVAASVALQCTDAERVEHVAHVAVLRDRLLDGLLEHVDGLHATVPREYTVAGAAHVCIEGIESEALLFLLDEASVCASAASACAAGAMEPSHVLAAMRVPRQWASGALRLTLGATTTAADIDRALDVLVDAVRRLRRHS